MKNLAIIPARSGSKGIKDKNIKLLNGKPLLAYSIDSAVESNMFTNIIVSTDSEDYAQISRKFGAEVPFLRSESISGDMANSWDAVKEVLFKYKGQGIFFDTICLLQPTSPLRTADDIVNAYKLLDDKKAEAVTSVCETEHSPLWCMTLDEDLSLREFNKNEIALPRQCIKKYYRQNGAIYIRHIDYSNEQIQLVFENDVAYIMSQDRSIDIDNMIDFKFAEFCLQEH
jgi:CMP-N,N'-diacetyllegionaminic acid synthase